MKIRKNKNIHFCNIDEAVNIINSYYKTLHFKNEKWYLREKSDIGNVVSVPFVFTNAMKKHLGKTINNFRAVKACRNIQVLIQEEGFKGFNYSLQMFEEFEDFIIEKK